MTQFTSKSIKELLKKYEPIWSLSYVSALAEWDLNTYMPEPGAKLRGTALGHISVLRKRLLESNEFRQLFKQATKDTKTQHEQALIRVLKHDTERLDKLPEEFLQEFQQVTNEAHLAWKQAREQSSYVVFQPYLEKIVELLRKQADLIGYDDHPYDALLDEYEEGLTESEVSSYFDELKLGLGDLSANGSDHDHPLAKVEYNKSDLLAVSHDLLDLFMAGSAMRLDESPHPFTSGLANTDVRITTRFHSHDVLRSILATIHEFGHGLYEMQIDDSLQMTPLGTGRSLSLHESQSRLWENMVGRTASFAGVLLPMLRERIPGFRDTDEEQLYEYMTVLRNHPLRVEADEVHYHQHIIIRFELEKSLITGELACSDLPDAWNAMYKDLLGIDPVNDAEGVLQDIHWSMGAIGYFPTYSIGTAVSAQLRNACIADGIDIDSLADQKDGFINLSSWLKETIHQDGAVYTLTEKLDSLGLQLSASPLLDYLSEKYSNESN